jgi:DNA-binding transcriptional ArsR family regulator
MNMSEYTPNSQSMADVFALIGQPSRLHILLAIGTDHACVCQLETLLGQRQAYISQQLMLLRDAGLVKSERSGRYIFYQLSDPRWLDLVKQAAAILGVTLSSYTLPDIEDCHYSPNKENSCEKGDCQ